MTLNFAGTAGETQTFTVATLDDALVEGNETFTVTLSASNANVDAGDTAIGTITENDTDLVVEKTVDNGTPDEGGTVIFTVTVTNSGSVQVTNVSLDDELPPGLTIGTVTPSQGSWSDPTWTIGTIDAGSSVTLDITATVNAGMAGQTITNTVTDVALDQVDSNSTPDDLSESITVGAILIEFDSAAKSDVEATGGNIPQLLIKGTSASARTIDVTISGGTATDGDDYTLTTTVTIPAGTYDGTSTTAITVPLGIIDDSIVESDETVILALSNPGAGFTIGDADNDSTIQNSHTYTITNDDRAGITISDVTAAEGNSGTTDFIFTVTLAAADPDDDIRIDYTTTDGAALDGSDYTATAGTLTFAAGTSTLSQQITVAVTGDALVEADETFTLDLSLNPANTGSAVISDGQGLGTITNDDSAGITISDVTAAEGNSGTTDFIFTVTLAAADPDDDIRIDYTTTDGAALDGSDYTATAGTLTFAAGTSTLSQQITVAVTGDALVEADETFTLDLSLNPANTGSAVISDGQGLGTITNDDSAGITISDVTAAEGNSGTTDFIFTVTLAAADPDDDIRIDYTTTDGAALDGSDYTATAGTLTFAAGTSTLSQQITVAVTGDALVEADETFTLDLSLNPANTGSAVISDGQGLGTITNDDSAGITISDVTAAEGNSGTTDFIFTVTLAAADPDDDIRIDYTTTDGAALDGSDYTATAGTLTFAAGTSTLSQQITVAVTGDALVEADETFTLDLSLNPANTGSAVISDGQGLGTITNDDSAGITISDVTAAEGNSGTTDFIFTVTLAAADPDDDIRIDYTTTDGAALDGSDYTATAGTLTFAAGTSTLSQQITVAVTGDALVEADETFTLDLSLNPANTGSAVISDGQGLGTITNDDSAGITISDVTAAEGNSGTTDFIFTVTLAAADPDDDIRIDYTTTDGAALDGSDYTATAGTLTFAAGTSTLSQQITVAVTGDALVEADETFTLDLSLNPANTGSAVISDGQGLGTITNDDSAGITISDVTAAEGNSGTTDFIFTVTLAAADPDDDIRIDYTTTDGAALDGSDYTATAGTLTFAAGTSTLSQQITVAVTGDALVEADETFTLDLSLNPANTGSAVISDGQGLGTITNDDSAGITISDVTAAEGNSGTTDFIFTVTLAAADPDDDIRIDYTTTDGAALDGSDYTATAGTLTFAAGTSTLSQQITVAVTGDALVEADETFTLDLSLNPANTGSAVISDGQGLGTITNDDSAGITISDVTAAEGNSGTTDFIFTVTLAAADPDDDIRIDYTTTDGAALDGSDYTATAGTLTFAAGTSTLSQQITVAVTGDALVEADETFTLDLSLNPANTGSAVISDGQGLGTITNDDSAGITISDVTAAEGNSGTTDFIFTVTLAAADPDDDIRIDYTTTDGAALDGSDYTATAGTLTFAAGTSTLSQQITVAVTGDALVEADETFTLDLSLNPANTGSAVISDGQGLGTITNDDSAGITISDVTAAEGNSGTTDFIFTVTLAAADPDDDIRIDYTTTDGAALDGSDYTATAGTLTFAAGTSTLSQQITVAVTGDALVEADETFTLDLSLNPANTGSAVISDGQGLGTITNDDSAGITISDVTAAEGNSGTTDFIFTVTLAAADPDDDIRIDYTTTDGAALDGSDYTATAGTLTFAAGTSTLSQQITVAVTGDALVEADETFTLDLSLNPANTGSAVISDGQGLGTITNDDSAGITISDVTAAEGNSGTTDFIFTVTLAAADPDDDIRIDYTTTDGAALDGSDYTATAGTLTFAAGTSTLSQQITVAVTGDALVEADETFTLDLSLNPANTGSAVISDGQGLGTITNDDSAGITISDVTAAEGNSGTTDFIFTVTLAAADPDDDIRIDYTTTDGAALDGSDYTATAGTLTFAAGTSTLSQQITVAVTGDALVEADETFTLDLSLNPANTGSAVISDGQGLGTITNDDSAGITISDVTAAEGNSGTTDFIFTVTLAAADPDDDIRIDYTTTDGAALDGSDYTATAGTLTFAAGTSTLSQQITVAVTGDALVEADETFTLDLSLNPANTGSAVISDGQGLGTITNDDSAGITISDVTAAEGNSGTTDFIFTVTLAAADPDDDIRIDYTTTDGAALDGSDYTATAGTLTFAAGTSTLSQQITVAVTGDALVEADETFTLDLSLNPANTGSAVISDGQGLGTITNDDSAGITISDVTAAEGNSGTTDFIFTVTLAAADPDDDIRIDYTTTDGAALDGSDYTATAGTLTFAAGTSTLSQQITVAVTGDALVEADETFTLDLSLNPANTGSAVISDGQGLGTITNDDSAGITISDVTAAEGNSGTTDFIFTVTLAAADPDDDIRIDYTTTDGAALDGSDYTATAGTLTFAAGTSTLSQQITVAVTGDALVEADETFTLDLSLNPANTGSAVISDGQGLGTITNDDSAGITISDVTAAEGNSGTTDFIFTVTLAAADPDDDIRIDYTTTDGAALDGSDYTATAGTLTFAAGTSTLSQQITVAVTGDALVEADETFTLDLSLNPANTGSAVISDGQGLGTITNDDSAGITISDVTAAEGNSGTTDFIFTVTLAAADPDDDIRIDYTTTDGAALDGSDYTATAGTLTFAAGTSTLSQQITVAVTGDALVEADETFTLDLSLNPANTGSAVISDGQGLGTITNDDSAGITISDVTAAEGNSGTTDFIFTVTLAAADPDDDIRIDYTTTDGAALDGSDYTATAGTLTFAAGTSTLSQQITVAVTGDALVEADETFTLDLSLNPANTGSAVISDGQGLGTITNDDSAGITISDVTAAEGNSGTTDFIFTVTLAAADPDDDIRIDYTTTDGAALDGSDYTATAGTLTFAAGTSTLSQQITVAVTGDALVEADETFTLDLSLNPANTGSAVISDGQGLGTITNDDSAGITISDVTAAEGNSGTTDFIFTVTLAAADPDDDIRIDYTTTDGAALDGSDYTATAGTLTFAAGTSTLSQQITVAVTGDALVEADETFTLDLSLNPANTGSAVISDGQGLGTITNDDSAGITISDVTAAEGNSGTTDFIFTVTLAAADPDDDIRIDYTTTDGAALDGSDYTATAGTLTFAAGTSTLSQQITVAVTGDALVEADETFTLDLSLNPANTGSAVISDGQGLGTITNDDSAGITISDVTAAEGNSGTTDFIFTVTLAAADPDDDIRIDYTTTDGAALDGSDYTATAGTLTFAAGTSTLSQQITVAVTGDALVEADETFTLDLSLNPANTGSAVISDGQGLGTITNDDSAGITISDVTAAEGNSGTTDFIFTVTLAAADPDDDIRIDYTTTDGAALDGSDYTATAGTLTFAAGTSTLSQQITVAVTGDALVEADETFTLDLSLNPANTGSAVISDGQGLGTITNDDSAGITISDVTAAEGNSGTTDFIFTVTLAAADPDDDIRIDYTTTDGAALDGSDYTATAGTLTFAAGTSTLSQQITVAVTGDALVEADETFTLDLSLNPANTGSAVISDGQGLGTITNDDSAGITISDVTAAEGNSGTTDFIFTVTLAAADPDDDIRIDYTTTDGAALDGSDYTATAGTLTFAAGTSTLSQQITVAVTGDALVEADETFTLDLSLNPANTGSAVISDGQGLGTITNDDSAGITISDVTAAEGNSGTTDFIFTVTLAAADPDDDIRIDYTTTDGAALDGSDYTATAGTLTFAAGTSTLSQQITVAVTGDALVEADETFTLDLSLNPANTGSAVISDGQGLGTITNDDSAGITISDVTAAEGNSGTTDFIFTVTLAAADPDDDIRIDYTTTDGAALDGSDYTATAGTLTFAAGTSTLSQQITVAVTGDALVEADETFTLDLSLNPANTGSAVISDGQGLGTITNDDSAGITISDVTAAEGNSGTTDFIFTVTLAAADPDDDIRIDYTTTDGAALDGSDYTATAGTLTFAAGTSTLSQQITVAVTGDALVEADETFTLDLSLNPANTGSAVISDGQGLGTITNDDSAGITISDVTAAEGNSGTTDFIFTVTLAAADPDDDIRIDYTTTDGAALDGSDYTATAGTLTFAAGTSTLSQQITVAVTGDALVEADETFTLDLSLNPANTGSAVISDGQGLGTITNDDSAGITISDVTAAEGNSGTTDFIFTVTLAAADPDDDIRIDYTTTDGAALDGSDYTATAGTLTFAAGTSTLSQQITVAVTGDALVEADETFTLDLSLNPANTGSAVISDGQGLGTITNDDSAGITISDVTAAEGNSGTTDFIFTVTLAAADPDDDIRIDYTTTDGAALDGSDYTATAGTLTFAAGTSTLSQQITVAVTGDALVEADETFTLDLSLNPANTGSAVISDGQGLGTITNDDSAGITISDVTAAEGNSGTTDFIFTVTLAAADPDDDIRIDYTTTDGAALDGSDYTATAGTLTFAAGTSTLSQQITVAVTGDALVEADETFTLDLSLNPANTGSAVISDGQGLGTITNDDSAGITISDVTAAEGNSGTTDFIFTVTLAAADPDDDIRIDYTTTDGAALDGSDYTATAGTLTFAAGTSTLSQQITVAVTGDALVEADETFTLDLSLNPANTGSAVISDGQGLGTITNDDSAGITISDVTAAEGNSGTTDFIFTVTLAAADPDDDIRIDYTTTDGAAFDGSDYTATAGTLTFAAGTSTLSQQITVAVTGDALVEADETFTLDLSLNPANTGSAVISDGQGLGTITNDDSAGITISDVTAAEGNSGTTDFIFTVTLAAADPDDDIRIDYTTTDGAALDGSDYTATAGTLTFAAGTSTLSQQITVAVTGDALVEADETFTLDLSLNPANTGSAVISDGQGLGTITNDDSAGITISDVTAAEGNSGTTDFIFTVTLAAADPDDDIRIDYTTTDGAALDGSDYTATAGTLTFAAGTSTLSQQITVAVTGDALVEADETFTLDLSLNPANTGSAVISDGQGLGTITNDDSAGITISDVTAAEGNSGTTDFIFTVTLAAADPDDDIRIDYTTTDGAAFDGSDYTATAGTLTFAAGTSTLSQQITVAVTGDALVEADETFTLDLSLNPANTGSAVISDGQGLGTITNDDSAGITISDVTAAEGNSGTTDFIFTVTLAAADPDDDIRIDYTTTDGAALDGSDYTATAGTLTFAAGTSTLSQQITVAVTGDALVEADETFTLDLSLNPANTGSAVISDGQGLGTILMTIRPASPSAT